MLFFVRYKKKKEKYLWCTTLNSHRQNVRVSQISRFKKKRSSRDPAPLFSIMMVGQMTLVPMNFLKPRTKL